MVSGESVSWSLDWSEVAVLDTNATALGVEVSDLMAAAGKALAHKAAIMAPEGEVLILCGPGNNGGDGFVAALELLDMGGKVRIIASHSSQKGEASQRFRDKCTSVEVWSDETDFAEPALLVDCLLGVGLKGSPRGKIAKMIDWVKPNNPPLVLACDIPSGLGSKRFLAADSTITFHAEKQGMLYSDVGEVIVAPLPWPPETVNCGPGDALRYPPLDPSAHKGGRGRVLIVGGGPYHGAPILAGRAAARIGCDLIHVAMPRNAVDRAIWPDHLIPERLLDEDNLSERGRDEIFKLLEDKSFDAVLIGPGLGRVEETTDMAREIIQKLAELEIPTVIDADAIYSLDEGVWPKGLTGVATPHERELRMWIWDEEPKNILVEEDIFPESRVIIRTGSVDQLTGLEGRYCECSGGHPRMATGGTGDLLAGVVAGLLAQGMNPWPASRLACYVMRVAGTMAANEFGPGLLASDVPKHIARALAKLTSASSQ